MRSKAELLQQFNQAREEMRGLLAGLDVHMLIYPGWTIKELLAHLAGWDDATILTLTAVTNNENPPVPAIKGIDFYNSQTVAERAALDYDQIVREWELVREQLNAILGSLADEKLGQVVVSPWGTHLSVADLIVVMAEHEEEHAGAIRARLAHPEGPLGEH